MKFGCSQVSRCLFVLVAAGFEFNILGGERVIGRELDSSSSPLCFSFPTFSMALSFVLTVWVQLVEKEGNRGECGSFMFLCYCVFQSTVPHGDSFFQSLLSLCPLLGQNGFLSSLDLPQLLFCCPLGQPEELSLLVGRIKMEIFYL